MRGVDLDLVVGYSFTTLMLLVLWCVPCDVRIRIGNLRSRKTLRCTPAL